jgi:hypothetical protein
VSLFLVAGETIFPRSLQGSGSYINHEDEGSAFIQKAGTHLPGYKMLWPTRLFISGRRNALISERGLESTIN